MRRRPKIQVRDQITAGDVVLATWYGLRLLGPGYSISIPEATYLTEKGELLEGTGVFPSRELQYVISDAEQGNDSCDLRDPLATEPTADPWDGLRCLLRVSHSREP